MESVSQLNIQDCPKAMVVINEIDPIAARADRALAISTNSRSGAPYLTALYAASREQADSRRPVTTLTAHSSRRWKCWRAQERQTSNVRV